MCVMRLSWIHASAHRVPTVIPTHEASIHMWVCTQTSKRNKPTPEAQLCFLQFYGNNFMLLYYISAFARVCWWFYLCVMGGMQHTRSLNESYVQSMRAAGPTSVHSVKSETWVAAHAAVSSSLLRPDFLNF